MNSYTTRSIPSQKPEVALVERPWGSFKQFAHNKEVTVSLMTVKAGQRLSLQSHTGRAELWIALDDHAIIQVGEDIFQARQGDEFWIPPNTKHRLTGGARASQVLEVAFGNWQQADIARYDDDYHRPELGE
jgi:mannose-1-phosphate guanylyltransferase/mannose-6-phosphate isomerase